MQAQNTQVPSANRYLWADFVRNIGIVLVILGHVSSIVLLRWRDLPQADWMAGNIYNVVARSCVPLLFMVSGALLLPRQESISDFYRKRFNRVVFPFIFWSVLYLLYKNNAYQSYTILGALKDIFYTIITSPAEYHLWFMYELFGVYLLTPVFRKLVDNDKETILWYFILIWFIFGPVLRPIRNFFIKDIIFDLGYLNGYIGYFVLGYLLTRIPIRKWMLWASAALYLAAAAFLVIVTTMYIQESPKIVAWYQNLLWVNIVFLAVPAFILLKAAGDAIFSKPRPRLARIAVALTSASFGMYLVHVFVLNFLRQHSLGPTDGSAILMTPVTTLLIFVISWAIIALLQKIPILRTLVA